TKGVYYAAETVLTAVAEMAFYRLLFFAESPQTQWPNDAAEYTAFAAAIRCEKAVDLTRPPLDRDEKAWTDPTDYAACQAIADVAREAGMQAIREFPDRRLEFSRTSFVDPRLANMRWERGR
ncbi:MAG: RES domain-containing protein, partial [Mesorhizobium sp.]